MKVADAMSRDVQLVTPAQTIREAARLMADCDIGAVPVGQDDRLVGVITDRDIAVRAVASGQGPDTKIQDVMSAELKYCFEGDELSNVAKNMGDLQVRRLPVVNRDKRLVGIVAMADLAGVDAESAGQAEAGITAPAGSQSQTRV